MIYYFQFDRKPERKAFTPQRERFHASRLGRAKFKATPRNEAANNQYNRKNLISKPSVQAV